MDKVRAARMIEDLRGKEVGGWRIIDSLGNGASAIVLSARKDADSAAIKIIDPEMIERFGEAAQLARLSRERTLIDHDQPNLVKIFDAGKCEATGFLYLAMELLGPTTHKCLTDAIPDLPRSAIAPLIRQLARVARYLLEDKNIVYRDIKPDNIMISNDYNNFKLCDLGVSLQLSVLEDAGTGETFVGTTRYSPPEFISRDEEPSIDGWSAVNYYQIGAVLHDMITRGRLFPHIVAPPVRLTDAVRFEIPLIEAPDVPAHLIQLAQNALTKDWRLRLGLVSWEDFENAVAVQTSTSQQIRERIRLRTAASQRLGSKDVGQTPPRRALLQRLGAEIATRVDDIRLRSGLFPPLDVRQRVIDGFSMIDISMGPSDKPRLLDRLEIQLKLTLLDAEEMLIHIKAAVLFGASPNDGNSETFDIYKGDHSSQMITEQLDLILHKALDADLSIGTPPPGGVRLNSFSST